MLRHMTNCDCCEVCTGICTGPGYIAVLCDECEREIDPEAEYELERYSYLVDGRWLCVNCALGSLQHRHADTLIEEDLD